MAAGTPKIAVWVLTPNGKALAVRIRTGFPGATCYYPDRLQDRDDQGQCFQRLTDEVARQFNRYDGHVFIMAAGIVVRSIAPLLRHKAQDPAVVVVDDSGQYAVSLLSGHIGGANQLARAVSAAIGSTAVITTATDVNNRPAVDVLALERNLKIENPGAIKAVNMAVLRGERFRLHDPYGLLGDALAQYHLAASKASWDRQKAGVYVDDVCAALPDSVLVLRPASLCAGIGCNRNAPAEEIAALLRHVCDTHHLASASLGVIASIDLKMDEPGLTAAAEALHLPLKYFTREELNQVRQVPNPSAMAAKHVGVQSVCEAAAILAADRGSLIVPKQKSGNVTVAIARRRSMSSASVPAV